MIGTVLWCLAAFVLATTLLPFTNSVSWWIRMWDFPRLHIAVLALLILVVALPLAIAFKSALIALVSAAFVYQAAQIFPYTPWATIEVHFTPAPSPDVEVTLLSVNVLMENGRVAELVEI